MLVGRVPVFSVRDAAMDRNANKVVMHPHHPRGVGPNLMGGPPPPPPPHHHFGTHPLSRGGIHGRHHPMMVRGPPPHHHRSGGDGGEEGSGPPRPPQQVVFHPALFRMPHPLNRPQTVPNVIPPDKRRSYSPLPMPPPRHGPGPPQPPPLPPPHQDPRVLTPTLVMPSWLFRFGRRAVSFK